MCSSRYHRVLAAGDDGTVIVADAGGAPRRVSLLAYDGPAPRAGEWIVVHSGYALSPADASEAEAAAAELVGAAELVPQPPAMFDPDHEVLR